MNDQSKDRIYRDPAAAATPFRFDETVARVFDDMIQRSVPGYAEVQASTALTVLHCAQTVGDRPLRVVDLGCSTGRSLRDTALLRHAQQNTAPLHWLGVDLSTPMLDKAEAAWKALPEAAREGITVEWREADITALAPQAADLVLLQYTLQFLPPADRPELLKAWAEQLPPGGKILVSEKVRFDDPDQHATQTAAHLDFKRQQGYSDLEIAGKRQALENVLRAEAIETNLAWLAEAGLTQTEVLGQWDVFASFSGTRS